MLPWVYEFHWSPFHVTFLLVFFSVFVTVATTLVLALRRTNAAAENGTTPSILWHSQFEDLSKSQRACRHNMTGEIPNRVCSNGFDCAQCAVHQEILRNSAVATVEHRPETILGLSFPTDRFYHRGHTWVRKNADGNFEVGMDEFARRVLGSRNETILPNVGEKLTVNGPAWSVKVGAIGVPVLSPVAGEVVAVGNEKSDWTITVRPTAAAFSLDHLLRGKEVHAWIVREMERLQLSLKDTTVGATLADGGELSPDLPRYFPAKTMNVVFGEIFLDV